ncbi:MAG TPA: serine/threonine-protein kinase [Candidatus Limnocylindria bacterium]|nr:serine/threonine-protein kinase [Candidatus Limnocylindria bacterium]
MQAERLLGDRYRLDHIAGHGAMATVFSAHDTVLKRTVAIKLFGRRHDETGLLHERFHREALVEARVVHPNVVTVHDIGEHEDGRPYIVMDFVAGRSLAEILADGPVAAERTAVIGIGIARALAAAHAEGIIHRDVKPANILIDHQGIPHLTDFGLARARGIGRREPTLPGTVVGSVDYVAPEQACRGAATPACDLYALGAVLHHMLAGGPPFGTHGAAGAIHDVERRAEEDPPPLHDVDEQLAALVRALLAPHPADRPATAAEVAERLLDVAARLRVERNTGDVPPPNATPLPASHWPLEEHPL